MEFHPLTEDAFAVLGTENRLVYIRPITAKELVANTNAHLEGISEDQILYAVCGADGERMAVMSERDAAFAEALAHEYRPVSVH